MRFRLPAAALVAAAAMSPFVSPADAAESYDNCNGTIAALPAVIDTQGVWCLKADVATSVTSGNAITVNAHNVTIDCNGFKIGGLGGGPTSIATGIYGTDRSNLTVRNCNIRGFYTGIYNDLAAGGGHVIEDNRFDGTIHYSIQLSGDGSVIRRNTINDIGPSDTFNAVVGIFALGDIDIIDNTIRGVTGSTVHPYFAVGIYHVAGVSGVIQNNRVSNLVKPPGGDERGIYVASVNVIIRDNNVKTTDATDSIAIFCDSNSNMSYDNAATGPGAFAGCHNGGGNVVIP